MSNQKIFTVVDYFFVILFLSPAPQVKFSHSTEQQAAQADSKPAVPATPLDESQPVTSIQIRLTDGTR